MLYTIKVDGKIQQTRDNLFPTAQVARFLRNRDYPTGVIVPALIVDLSNISAISAIPAMLAEFVSDLFAAVNKVKSFAESNNVPISEVINSMPEKVPTHTPEPGSIS